MHSLADAIDHVVIGTPDLEAARAEFMELGFQVTPHGVHEKFGTDNYLVILKDSYIELLGMTGRPAESRASLDILEPCTAAGGGVPMLALTADDMEAAYQRLRALGVRAKEPVFWSRPADTPDGPRTASFTTMFLDGPLLPSLSAFYCKHHTVEFVRHPVWRRQENGASRLHGLIRRSSVDLRAARGRREYLGEARSCDDGIDVVLGGHYLAYRPDTGAPRTEIHLAVCGDGREVRHNLHSVGGVSVVLERA